MFYVIGHNLAHLLGKFFPKDAHVYIRVRLFSSLRKREIKLDTFLLKQAANNGMCTVGKMKRKAIAAGVFSNATTVIEMDFQTF